jgi:hypothetical protein
MEKTSREIDEGWEAIPTNEEALNPWATGININDAQPG